MNIHRERREQSRRRRRLIPILGGFPPPPARLIRPPRQRLLVASWRFRSFDRAFRRNHFANGFSIRREQRQDPVHLDPRGVQVHIAHEPRAPQLAGELERGLHLHVSKLVVQHFKVVRFDGHVHVAQLTRMDGELSSDA